MGELLDRAEAIEVLKEIISSTNCDSSFVALMLPNAHNVLSKGYQIYIKTQLDTSQRKLLVNILEKNGLTSKYDAETLVIYKPIHSEHT